MTTRIKKSLTIALLAFAAIIGNAQTAYFEMNRIQACDSFYVRCYNKCTASVGSSVDNDYTYTWNIEGNTTIIKKNTSPIRVWLKKPGLNKITLTMAHNTHSGEKASYTNSFLVRPKPNAWFTVADTFALGNLTYRIRTGKVPADSIKYIYRYTLDGQLLALHDSAKEKRDTTFMRFSSPGEHTVALTVKDWYGCTARHDTVFYASDKLIVPKVFTPNGDNINDYLFVETNGRDIYHFEVFNSNGLRVFHSESPSIMWDGIIEANGQEAPAGTYYYILEPKSAGGKAKTKGYFVLLRKK
ncbi:MAG TPA: gliding motility-associated C-terminal domain-containing protein [Bacteroidales bacterium]|nr:gliding motility-associated C-terminal domain-containing protein [Bacteroidales bacterium]